MKLPKRCGLLLLGVGRNTPRRGSPQAEVFRVYLGLAIHHGRLDLNRCLRFRSDSQALGCLGVA